MKKIMIYILLVVFGIGVVEAQEQKQTIDRADEYFSRYEYALAARLYEKLADRKNPKAALLEKLATCYRKTNDYVNAAKWYARLTQYPGTDTINLLYYADMLKSAGRYSDARDAYHLYIQKTGNSTLATARLAGCDSAILWMRNPTQYRIDNLHTINTASADWGAVWYGNDSIVFTSDYMHPYALDSKTRINKKDFGWTDQPYQKLYIVDSTARNGFGFISDLSAVINRSLFHVGPVVFSKNGDTAYITYTNPGRIPYKREKPSEVYGTRRLELYVSVKKNGQWRQPQPFVYNKPDEYSIGHAALSRDGRILYFTSDKKGGYGATDIWYCEKLNDSTWDTPKNCGPVINTAGAEEFPTIVADGNALYFSSDGHAGMGGLDLFKAEGSAAQWNSPVNLQYPLNSPGDDFYYETKDQYTGFLSSNRPGGIGSDDIYRFVLDKPAVPYQPPAHKVIILETTVLDKQTDQPVTGAWIQLTNTERNARWRQLTPATGKVYNVIEPGASYALLAGKNGFDTSGKNLDTKQADLPDTVRTTIYLDHLQLKPGDSFVLENLFYDLDKWNIRPDAAQVLDSLAEVLKKHPNIRIALSAHTDSRASKAYNMQLSEKRAKSAVAYLVKQGIAPGRLVARWYGESQPVNGCVDGVECTEAEHQANRRTEVKVLE